jgi:hypothetical protein
MKKTEEVGLLCKISKALNESLDLRKPLYGAYCPDESPLMRAGTTERT